MNCSWQCLAPTSPPRGNARTDQDRRPDPKKRRGNGHLGAARHRLSLGRHSANVKLADALVVATALERGRPGVTEDDDYDQLARERPALQVLRVWRLPGRTPIPALIRIMHFSQCRHRSSRQFVRSCVGATAAGRTCRPPDPPTNMPAHRRTSNPAPRPNGDGRTRLSVALRARLPESAASLLV